MIPFDNRPWAEHTSLEGSLVQMKEVERNLLTTERSVSLRWLKLVATALCCLLLIGCTNSKLIIGPLYNRLDDQMRSEFNKLGDFNEEQTEAFEQAVGTFHVWHRQSEMPGYANLIQEIATSMSTAGDTSRDDVNRWAVSIEKYSRNARECHPANYLFGLMQSLTDEQINFIENRFKSERKKNRERRANETKEERIERRLSNVVKWAGRVGLDLTNTQKDILKATFSQQISLRNEYYALSDEWNRKLFILARNQENPNYKRELSDHVDTLWTLMEDNHPEQWRATRDLWRNTAFTLISSLSDSQRKDSSRWLNKMGATIRAISKDEPSFKTGTDPSIGCLVPVNN